MAPTRTAVPRDPLYVIFGHKPDEAVTVTGTVIGSTINGSDFRRTRLNGLGGNDTLIGNDGDDILVVRLGNDTLQGGDGNDTLVLARNLTAADRLDGGAGHDTLSLNGDYSAGVTFDAATMINVETLRVVAGHDYALTLNDGNVAAGETLLVSAATLGSGDTLHFDGSAELDGHFVIDGGAGADVLVGGAQHDVIRGNGGNNTVTGGGGSDSLVAGAGTNTFVYGAVSDSTGVLRDNISGFNADADHFAMGFTVSGVNAAVTSGGLGKANFDSDLAADIGAAQLSAFHAVLFTPDSGGLAGKTFLIVDANGVAGYQAGQDFVIELTGATHLTDLSAASFT